MRDGKRAEHCRARRRRRARGGRARGARAREGRRGGHARGSRDGGREPERGQATLEYLLLLAAFMAMVLALGSLWHAARDGRLLDLASGAASHGSGSGTVALLKDVVGY